MYLFTKGIFALVVLSVSGLAGTIPFVAVNVPATAVIWSADGNASAAAFGGTSAVQAVTFAAGDDRVLTFSLVTGQVGSGGTINIGPDGYGVTSNILSLGSISGYSAPRAFSLVGVFTNGVPAGSPPPGYDYSAGLSQVIFSPLLNQVFFIGDGFTGNGSGSPQQFVVPGGATSLYLGFADAGTFVGNPGLYSTNAGSLSVTGSLASVPEPSTFAGVAIVVLLFLRFGRSTHPQ